MNNKKIIEQLKGEIERGESSLDTTYQIYSILREVNIKLYNKFANAYEKYANDEVEISEDLLNKMFEALEKAPEPKKERNQIEDIKNQLE